MGLLFLLAAILGLIFPPFAVVVLALAVLGVFAKGVAAESQEPSLAVRRKTRERYRVKQPGDPVRHHATASDSEKVIDARSYPVLPPLRLPSRS